MADLPTYMKVYVYITEHPGEIIGAVRDHILLLVATPVLLAVLIAVPLGILATRYSWLEKIVLGIASVMQTIPSLAMLAMMLVIGLPIGYQPAILALFLYSLLPILRNTYTGIKNVDPFIKEAATGMGMTDMQRLRMVELPIAFSVMMAGIRTATVICIGTGTLAAMAGAGGLGVFIVRGLQLFRDYLIIIGAVPAALLALGADYILGRIEDAVIPRGRKG